MAVCWVILRGEQIYTVIQAVHSLLYIVKSIISSVLIGATEKLYEKIMYRRPINSSKKESRGFEATANLHCYTSCALTTLHCSNVSFLQCSHMKRYNKIFTKMWGVYPLLWDTVYAVKVIIRWKGGWRFHLDFVTLHRICKLTRFLKVELNDHFINMD